MSTTGCQPRASCLLGAWIVILVIGSILPAQEVGARWLYPAQAGPPRVLSPFHALMRADSPSAYLHGGVDLAAPPGTAVLAVVDGTLWIYTEGRFENVVLTPPDGSCWEYRHVAAGSVPAAVRVAAREGRPVPAGTELGRVAVWGVEGYDHIHLNLRSTEGRILDPLARLPVEDTLAPTIEGIHLLPADGAIPFPADAAGVVAVARRVDIAIEAWDALPGTGFTGPPQLLAYRIDEGDERRFAPFQDGLPGPARQPVPRYPMRGVNELFLRRGALASRNPTWTPEGQRWVMFVSRGAARGAWTPGNAWDSREVADGEHVLHVTVADGSGNVTHGKRSIRVANGSPPAQPAPGERRPAADDAVTAWPGETVRHVFLLEDPSKGEGPALALKAPPGARVVTGPSAAAGEGPVRFEVEVPAESLHPGWNAFLFRLATAGGTALLNLRVEVVPLLEVVGPLVLDPDGAGGLQGRLAIGSRVPLTGLAAFLLGPGTAVPVRSERVADLPPHGVMWRVHLPTDVPSDGMLGIEARGPRGSRGFQRVPVRLPGDGRGPR